jgi:predicted Rossmann fold flavoprotein
VPSPFLAEADVAVVGAGAAGLATAIFTRHLQPAARVVVLDGARRPGAKILVSGGSRCNVTNVSVSDADYNGGRRSVIRRILKRLPVHDTIEWFRSLGVPLHEEEHGKLFPDSNRSRDVLDALLREMVRTGADLRPDHRVVDVAGENGRFVLTTSRGAIAAGAVVLATGGLSLPKTGSDGAGYAFARNFGHTVVPTTPALVPLILDGDDSHGVHREVSGVAHKARLDLWLDGAVEARVPGSLLWTHFGISGPAALDMSRHWLNARQRGAASRLTAALVPDESFETLDARWVALTRTQPRASIQTGLASMVPASLASGLLDRVSVARDATLAALTRDVRRQLVNALLEWPLPVIDSRGYSYAEVTAGGVSLDEIDSGTMQSRLISGLYLVGEILDVDGRLGGFNFQWAWSSARVAAQALAASVAPAGGQSA